MPINYDFVQRGVIRRGFTKEVTASKLHGLQNVLFGGQPIPGDANTGIVMYDFRRKGATHLSEEAIRGADPNRVNFRLTQDTKFLKTAYFFDKDTISYSQVLNRVWGEPIEAPWSYEQRMAVLASEKIEALKLIQMNSYEKLCADMLLTGKCTVRDGGEQVMPLSSALLSVDGSKLLTDPVKTVFAAIEAMNRVNGSVISAANLIMNSQDALNLVQSTRFEKLVIKDGIDIARVQYGPFLDSGFVHMGTINCFGGLHIWAYQGIDGEGAKFIPQGKAILTTNVAPMTIGSKGVGSVLVSNGSNPSVPMVIAERLNVYPEGKGDLVQTNVTYQTAPLPIITAIDGYCVLTGIPASEA